jgi:hypothetical protein
MASQNFGAFINAAAAATLAGTDLIPAVQSSVTKKTTPDAILALLSTRTVAQGGTGLATLTANSVLIGAGTGNVQFVTIGTAGRLLVDQGAAANPAFVAMSGDGTLASSGAITVNSVTGSTAGTDAASGKVGEIVKATVASGSAVALANNTPKTITSVSLTAGRWLVYGMIGIKPAGTTFVLTTGGGASQTTNTLPPEANMSSMWWNPATAGLTTQFTFVPRYLTFNATTTIYLVTSVQFTVSTCGAFGEIVAQRIA